MNPSQERVTVRSALCADANRIAELEGLIGVARIDLANERKAREEAEQVTGIADRNAYGWQQRATSAEQALARCFEETRERCKQAALCACDDEYFHDDIKSAINALTHEGNRTTGLPLGVFEEAGSTPASSTRTAGESNG